MVGRTLRFGSLGLRVAAASAIGLGGGYWPTLHLAGPAGVAAMVVGAACAGGGLAVGLIILALRTQVDDTKLAMTFLMTAPVRMFVTLAAGGAAWMIGRWPIVPLLVWVAIFYLLLLAAEASWLTRLLKERTTRTQ